MRDHVDAGGDYDNYYGEGKELELSGIRNMSESIIEEHEVSSQFFLKEIDF